jgi:mersacidin/lichenicidin family type 2 lantibiotic
MNDIRAWKDPAFRRQLGEAAPSHPAGIGGIELLTDDDLATVNGAGTRKLTTHGCCHANLTISTACSLVCAITYFLC